MKTPGAAVEVEGRKLELSNLDKVLYPAAKFTKAQVIDYYRRIAPALLPHLAGRPLTLKRYPNGVDEMFFYEKNAPRHRPPWVETTTVWSRHNDKDMEYLVAADLPTLIWTSNLAALELHVSLSRAPKLEQPTAIVFDLDPGPPAELLDCLQVAVWLHTLLEKLGLRSFPKTSGKKGLQVYVPLNTPATYDDSKAFAHAVAQLLERDHPERVLSLMKKELRTGKVFVDWSQNDQSKTTVSVYSLRAEPRPMVSAPLTWSEVRAALKKKDAEGVRFDAEAVVKRFEKDGDLFAPLLTLKQKLPTSEAAEAAAAETKEPEDSLEEYERKRDFTVTDEPAPSKKRHAAPSEHPSYMIHKHHATRLHYDLRLEMDGALASWAIPKGPTNDPGVKRLAVQTEDHPLEYGKFEGRIPDGEYGAGDSIIWDRGFYDTLPPGQASAQRKKGHLHLVFAGDKLNGAFHLVKTKQSEGKKASWIFFRDAKDVSPTEAKVETELVDERPESVVSGRRAMRGPETKKVLNAPHPAAETLLKMMFPPMLATLAEELPGDEKEWVTELKYDGFRAVAALSGGKLALWSRNELDLAPRFAEVAAAVAKIVVGECVLDGEIVALDENHRAHFDQMGQGNEVYVAFDLLYLDGRDLRGEPLSTRRELLESLLSKPPKRVQLSERVPITKGMVAAAAKRGFEGIVAKKAESLYEPKRSAAWLKLKAVEQQELAIVGYTLKTGDAHRVGALLLGVMSRGKLHFAGRVGTGFSEKVRSELYKELSKDHLPEGKKPELADAPRLQKAVWTTPRLVADIKFTEWTKDGKLRHPAFVRLRPDKQPEDCVRERARH